MKKVAVEEAVGMVLCHDITRIVPASSGRAFRKGHCVQAEDIPLLKDLGKEHRMYSNCGKAGFTRMTQPCASPRRLQAPASP